MSLFTFHRFSLQAIIQDNVPFLNHNQKQTFPTAGAQPRCHLDRNAVEWRDLPRIQIVAINMGIN